MFVRRSDGDVLCAAIDRYRCTGGFVIGPMVDAIVEANADGAVRPVVVPRQAGHARVRRDGCSPTTVAWGRNAGGYGQTEVMGMATFNLLGPGGIGTHGRPSPLVDVRVVDEDDDEVAAGETGEIVVRGTTVMNGYWNRPELNAHAPAQRLAPHQRPRSVRGRRHVHVRRARRRGCSSRRPRTSIRSRSRTA